MARPLADAQRNRAAELREQGLSYRAIAAELGISRATAYRWLNPDFEEEQRQISLAWKNRNREANRARERERNDQLRATCEDCGQPCGKGSGKSSSRRAGQRCAACRRAAHEQRMDRIAELYEAGASMAAIAAELDTTRGAISQDLLTLRRAGRIGYRYQAYVEAA